MPQVDAVADGAKIDDWSRRERATSQATVLEIVLAGMRDDETVLEVCREPAIAEALSHGWGDKFRADVREVGELLQRRDSYLVMFGGFFPGVLADADDLERAFPLRPVARFADGTIYQRAGL
jgi:hypothetical protein